MVHASTRQMHIMCSCNAASCLFADGTDGIQWTKPSEIAGKFRVQAKELFVGYQITLIRRRKNLSD
jgi:hypothetical protein